MTYESNSIVPVWTLATGDVRVPAVSMDEPMTAERLADLRGALASLADHPVATLEMRPLPAGVDRSRGIPLDAASPLAQNLSQLIARSARNSPASVPTAQTGEVLYRMMVPAKVAEQFGQGTVRSMRAAGGGVYSALRDSKGIVAHARYVPVAPAAAAGTVGEAGAAAGVAVAGAAAVTLAAPLVLMAVAAGISARAERQRQLAIDHITELVEQLREEKLEEERNELDGCRDAIDKATGILIDEGKIGHSLGLDSAVHAIGQALAATDRRLAQWQRSLAELPDDKGIEVDELMELFPGIGGPGGKFRAHLELAALAIALKRRVIVLQAVEHAQLDPGNLFENFTRALKADQRRLDKLESDIAGVLVRLSSLQLARPRGLRAPVFTAPEVDRLMRATNRIHELGEGVEINNRPADLAIDIVRDEDGSVVVFPASAT